MLLRDELVWGDLVNSLSYPTSDSLWSSSGGNLNFYGEDLFRKI